VDTVDTALASSSTVPLVVVVVVVAPPTWWDAAMLLEVLAGQACRRSSISGGAWRTVSCRAGNDVLVSYWLVPALRTGATIVDACPCPLRWHW